VLPIGGLKEKLLAAKRAGILEVIIPDENKRELSEIPSEIYEGIKIHPVHWIDEVFNIALTRELEPFNLKAEPPISGILPAAGPASPEGPETTIHH
jgi:ATP-dependent Lon protease